MAISEDNDDNPTMNEKGAQLIPDFFYEFISRIIPGLIVIALCFFWSGTNFDSKSITTPFLAGTSFFSLLLGWVIGTTLDVGVFVVANPLKEIFVKKNHHEKKSDILEADYWEGLKKMTAWERNYFHKQTALKIFFRNMASICFLTTIIIFIHRFGLDSEFPALERYLPDLLTRNSGGYLIWSLFFGVIFFFGWRSYYRSDLIWKKRIKDLLKEKTSNVS